MIEFLTILLNIVILGALGRRDVMAATLLSCVFNGDLFLVAGVGNGLIARLPRGGVWTTEWWRDPDASLQDYCSLHVLPARHSVIRSYSSVETVEVLLASDGVISPAKVYASMFAEEGSGSADPMRAFASLHSAPKDRWEDNVSLAWIGVRPGQIG